MSRANSSDDSFKRLVAKEFALARERARKKGLSMEEFVRTLGITRAAFHKHVTCQAIPRLAVLEKARRFWGVEIRYGALDTTYVKARRKDPRQMEFSFSIEDISKEQIEIKRFSPKGEKGIELLININFTKSA